MAHMYFSDLYVAAKGNLGGSDLHTEAAVDAVDVGVVAPRHAELDDALGLQEALGDEGILGDL